MLEGCGNFAYTLSPNPAADEVQVQETNPEPTARNGGISAVRVYDGYGRLRLERPGHGARALRLPLRELPAFTWCTCCGATPWSAASACRWRGRPGNQLAHQTQSPGAGCVGTF